MTETAVVLNGGDREPREYWCPACRQLRLDLKGVDACGNCGFPAEELIFGAPGELNADALRAGGSE